MLRKTLLIIPLLLIGLILSYTDVNAYSICSGTGCATRTVYSCQFTGGGPLGGGTYKCVGNGQTVCGGCSFAPNAGNLCVATLNFNSNCQADSFGCDINESNTFTGSGCYSCTSSCGTNICGEPDGCGGTCPSYGLTTWTPWACGSCDYRGGCGNVNLYTDCTSTNLCGTTINDTQVCGGLCHECGPYISEWGGWSACTAPSFSRTHTRSCNEDCDTDNCDGVALSQDETCYGTIYGTFFDASLVDTCATYASQNKVAGAIVNATATTNHTTTYTTSTDGNGSYANSNLLIPDTYNLSFTLPTGVRYIDNPPKLLCDGALGGIALANQGDTVIKRVGLWRIYGGWFQSQGGGVYGAQGITVTIPATCLLAENITTCNSFTSGTVKTPLIVADAYGGIGTAYAGESYEIALGGGGTPASNAVVSSSNQQADSSYEDRTQNYSYFIKQGAQYQNTEKTAWGGSGKPSGASNGLYKTNFTTTLSIGTGTQPGAGEQIVIFHDGDVNITSDIDVPVGSFLGIVATGSIRVEAGVGRAEGVYIADQNFEVLSSGDENTEVRFVGEGSFVGLGGVNLLRTRGLTNNSESSEFFIFRPDFVINSPYGLRLPQYTWREVAP